MFFLAYFSLLHIPRELQIYIIYETNASVNYSAIIHILGILYRYEKERENKKTNILRSEQRRIFVTSNRSANFNYRSPAKKRKQYLL